MVMNMCGRGDKDIFTVAKHLGFDMASVMGNHPMTTRIDTVPLKAEGRPGFNSYIMSGDPDYDTSLEIIDGLPEAGADVIELGMCFTDPMADGVAIQAAQRALAGGQTLPKTLELVQEFRKQDSRTPLILMGYYNPIYIYWVDAFLAAAKAAGVDGLIVVDLPPEEDDELCIPANKAGMNFIRLATPTTDEARLPAVLQNASGFVYYVVDHRHHRRRTKAQRGWGRAKPSGG